jgi:hypothetical protein
MAPPRQKQLSSFFLEKSICLPPFDSSISFANQFNNNSLAKNTFNILFKVKYQNEKGFSRVVFEFLEGILETFLVPLCLSAFTLS